MRVRMYSYSFLVFLFFLIILFNYYFFLVYELESQLDENLLAQTRGTFVAPAGANERSCWVALFTAGHPVSSRRLCEGNPRF